jgi:spore coat protein U-like protein
MLFALAIRGHIMLQDRIRLAAAGNGSAQSFTACGRLPAQATPRIGTYSGRVMY